jgi:hypothetical protein
MSRVYVDRLCPVWQWEARRGSGGLLRTPRQPPKSPKHAGTRWSAQ